jgi:hypothetical protein
MKCLNGLSALSREKRLNARKDINLVIMRVFLFSPHLLEGFG